LLVSVLLRPDVPSPRVALMTTAAGLALGDAVLAEAGFSPGLKWPNDLVVADRKLAGILAETVVSRGKVRAVVVGTGCNVRSDAVPAALAGQATACEIEARRTVDRGALLAAFLDALAARVRELGVTPDRLVDAARARSATLGRPVRVDFGDGRLLEGEAVDLTPLGELVVRDQDGTDTTVAVGDVVVARPATTDADR
jgi:BirA family biotin operon repressor/biotin-[acetyl-CoA-carboxylase] ligase